MDFARCLYITSMNFATDFLAEPSETVTSKGKEKEGLTIFSSFNLVVPTLESKRLDSLLAVFHTLPGEIGWGFVSAVVLKVISFNQN